MADNAILQISFVGYQTSDVSVKGQNNIKVVLSEDTETLDEVVVIGYGSVKKSTLTGAVAKMDSKAIEDRPLARAENALQGQLAGVTVRNTTGEPGADMQIRVRGAASVNANSDPLYVVDGVPMNTLSGLNPSDIASIEVLKMLLLLRFMVHVVPMELFWLVLNKVRVEKRRWRSMLVSVYRH